VETEFISDLARKLARVVPGSGGDLDVMREDLERNFRGLLAGAFERLNLVTREEFDVQRRVTRTVSVRSWRNARRRSVPSNSSGPGRKRKAGKEPGFSRALNQAQRQTQSLTNRQRTEPCLWRRFVRGHSLVLMRHR